MSDVRTSMQKRVVVAGMTLALSLGCLALTGCGGSTDGSAASDEATDAAATETAETEEAEVAGDEAADEVEEAAAEEVEHWYQVAYETTGSNQFYDEDRTDLRKSEDSASFSVERDEHGSIIKYSSTENTKLENNFIAEIHSTTEKTIEYTNDDRGYPLTKVTEETGSLSQIVGDETNEFEPTSSSTTAEYRYKFDDQDRLVRAVSTDDTEGAISLRYNDNGTVARARNTNYITEGNDDGSESRFKVVTTVYYDDEETPVKRIMRRYTEDGGEQMKERTTYNEDGNPIKTVTTYADGSKVTGESDYQMTSNGEVKRVMSTFTDGTKTGMKYQYDKDGNVTRKIELWADGARTTTTYTYDEDGNEISSKAKLEDDDDYARQSERTEEKSWVYVEEPAEYLTSFLYRQYGW